MACAVVMGSRAFAWGGCRGVKNAVPKTILQLMNVEGMTRENVASHLQKYRLYLKRMAGYPPAARLPLDTLQQVQQVTATAICFVTVTSHVPLCYGYNAEVLHMRCLTAYLLFPEALVSVLV